ncbi:MAG: phosphate ABC transporter permease PstA [Rhodospirillales bacterium]|nr:phosphate ABC transporter permease PstA [Rhodospirillales bacterium]
MTDTIDTSLSIPKNTSEIVHQGLKKRYAAEKRFRRYGVVAVCVALLGLVVLFSSILTKGYTAFYQTNIQLDITFDESVIDPKGTRKTKDLSSADYAALLKKAMRTQFPEVKTRRDKKKLYNLVSSTAVFALRAKTMADPSIIGQTHSLWLTASDDVDMLIKGHIPRELPENERRISNKEISWVDQLIEAGSLEKQFNRQFFSAGDSREPEAAGIKGAIIGSFYTLLVTLLLTFPTSVAAAIYLEEFAPKNRWTAMIEVNINNLAAVPSIVFGLLGLAIFLNVMHLPRSAPIVGGLVLALMTLPTIIIASRAALKSVPPSIRAAALGLGATRMQTVFHHVLPLAMPGIMTGTIIGMAQALGETAPLLMIGMVAFIVDVPGGPTDPSTVLPVQIFLWADAPERAFVERTSAAILVLLGFLVSMNALAIFLRKKFERHW